METETGGRASEVEVKLQMDQSALKEMNELKELLHSPNLTTALYNAVSILNDLYHFQREGYELRLVKRGGETHRFRLPE
jgi:hypothetical protein